jgi:hypothetical protein
MAMFALLNAQVVINSVDLSNRINSVELKEKFADLKTTAFGQTAETRVGGLGDHSFQVTFLQDYASAEVDATINPILNTVVPVAVKAVNAATSTVNPAWTFSVLVNDYTPMGGKVGEIADSSATWPVSGAVTRATA